MSEPKRKKKRADEPGENPCDPKNLEGNEAIGEISSSLRGHIRERVENALIDLKLIEDLDSIKSTVDSICEQLFLESNSKGWKNKEYSQNGTKIFKLLLLAKANPQLEEPIKDTAWNIAALVHVHDSFITCNKQMYQSIQSHHKNVGEKDWKDVAHDAKALTTYRDAAHAMGDKRWVYEANQWMTNYATQFYCGGGAKRQLQKLIRAQTIRKAVPSFTSTSSETIIPTINLAQVELLEDNLWPRLGNTIKLLDVGSCYNPLNTPENQKVFEITAVDLCPAHSSVYQCDFLTVTVNSEETTLQTEPLLIELTHTGNTTQSSQPDNNNNNTLRITAFPKAFYNVVTFSLVLCYLPTPEAREKMIDNARAVLLSNKDASCYGRSPLPPHYEGLLIIVEKPSILSTESRTIVIPNNNISTNTVDTVDAIQPSSSTEDTLDDNEKIIGDNKEIILPTVQDWKDAICARGFTNVIYQNLSTSDQRKAHIFVFATAPIPPPLSTDNTIQSKRLYIKQDFCGQDVNEK